VAWKGGGQVVSKGKGVVLFSFFFPLFEMSYMIRK